MPRGNRKQLKTTDRRRKDANNSGDDESVSENGSIASSVSEIRSVYDDTASVDPDADDITEQDSFEDRLKEAIDGATQKSAKGRQSCLDNLTKCFCGRYLYDFIQERQDTLADCVERSLRKGKGEEQASAATLLMVLCIQLGAGEADKVFRKLRPYLLEVASNTASAPKARSHAYSALGLGAFVTSDLEDIAVIMPELEAAFRGSYLKGNGAIPCNAPDVLGVHTAALAAWSLLLTLLPPAQLITMIESHLNRLPQLLDSPDLDLRITAGESIAMFYEIIREFNEGFEGEILDDLCYKLRELATDSHKYRAKKDRKQQRSSFRDILHTVEDREAPNFHVKFGREVLVIDSWCRKRQYDALCHSLGSGMNLHLTENDLLRDIFELGSPLGPLGPNAQKTSKFERHMGNLAADKARTVALSKVRDKRAVVF